MHALLRHSLLLCILAALAPAAVAETVTIPVGQQGQDMQGIQTPARGMTMDAVTAQFGAPSSKSTPVGNPPITYWDYDKYTVYFEYDKVLDTVLNFTGTAGAAH